ncbi:aminopeptidase N-like isoform X2 [Lycorma delicatula]
MLVTDFQPIDARTLFPCWDEPSYKVSSIFNLAKKPEEIALSNMPLNYTSERLDKDGKVWDTFEEAPPMSTYTMALAVGKLSSIQCNTNGKNISIWTNTGKEELGRYALNFTARVLEKLEEYTQIDYLLPKLDQIAIPVNDFDAMENWGLITYVERYLLLEDDESIEHKQEIGQHVTHEVSHQWFGNLVTLEWWDAIWLNEGFATFFERFIQDLLEPDWRTMEKFVVTFYQQLLDKESLPTARALSSDIESLDAIEDMFDRIAYNKGATLVRMLYHIMTPELFQLGIQKYLNMYMLNSVTDDELLDSFQEVMDEHPELELPAEIGEIMLKYIYGQGFAVVKVERKRNDSLKSDKMILTQKRFFEDDIHYTNEDVDVNIKWWIPLSYTTSTELNFNDTKPREWFNQREHELNLDLKSNEWFILNIQSTGYYRVNYDPKTWILIIDYMTNGGFAKIHPLNRAALIDDSFALALSNNSDINIAMDLTKYLYNETDFIPWITAKNIFKRLDKSLWGSPARPLFQEYINWLMTSWLNKIRFDVDLNTIDSDNDKVSRSVLLEIGCYFKNIDCEKIALDEFNIIKKSDKGLDELTEIELMYICMTVSEGPTEFWNYIKHRYLTDKIRNHEPYLDLLACTKDKNIIMQMLKDTLKKNSFIKEDDKSNLLTAILVAAKPEDVDELLKFFSTNLQKILKSHGTKLFERYILKFALTSNKEILSKVDHFLEKHSTVLKESIPSIKYKIKNNRYTILKDEHYDALYEWLKQEEVNFRGIDETEPYNIPEEADESYPISSTTTSVYKTNPEVTTPSMNGSRHTTVRSDTELSKEITTEGPIKNTKPSSSHNIKTTVLLHLTKMILLCLLVLLCLC